VGDAASDHRALIALANARRSFRWHELIASVAAHDRNLATTEPLTHRVIDGDATYLIAIDNIVSLIGLSSRQAVLFDQLLDLRVAGFFCLPVPFVGGSAPDRERLCRAAPASQRVPRATP
jgi:hypothetical protein